MSFCIYVYQQVWEAMRSNEGEEVSPSDWSTDHKFNNTVSAASLDGINWRNYSDVTTPSCYKLFHLDKDDLTLLKSVYQVMYGNRDIVPSDLGESIHKYGSIKIWSTTLGSKL